MLKDFLPDFLVENAYIYSILSKGIHELTEEECQQHFTPLRNSIELILDERLLNKEREEKSEQIRQKLGGIQQSPE